MATTRARAPRNGSAPEPETAPTREPGDLHFSTKATAPAVEREPLFWVDGHPHGVPTTPLPASLGLEYSRRMVEVGIDAAVVFALRTALGDEGYAALLSIPDLSADELRTINRVCTRKLVDSWTGPKAN